MIFFVNVFCLDVFLPPAKSLQKGAQSEPTDRRGEARSCNIDYMDEIGAADGCLRSARDSPMQDLDSVILALDNRDTLLNERVQQLNRKKHEIAQAMAI